MTAQRRLTQEEKEFLVIARQLKRSDLRKLMAQARALIDYKE
jgi:hypothetical protein